MGKDYNNVHYNNIDTYAKKIAAVYDSAIKEAANITLLVNNFSGDKLFSFVDYPIIKDRIDKLLKSLTNNIEVIVLNGIDHEWTLSNNKNSELSRIVFGDNIGKMSREQEQRYFNNNHSARDTFKSRKISGLNLSDSVWKYTNGFKHEIELGIDCGLRDRLSAAEMARDLKQYLQSPDKLFRRVRGEHGNLALSKAAKAFNPGQGVYRSSVRNTQRLARTEINMAYHASDHERWQQLDFVVGIEVRRSNNHSFKCPLCDSLAGKYPKEFVFSGWHPQCRCHAISILKTTKEMQADNERILNGTTLGNSSVNKVNDVNSGFTKWTDDNKERFSDTNAPYFIRDNFIDGKIDKGLKFSMTKSQITTEIDNNAINTLIFKAKDSGDFVQGIAKSIAMNNNSLVTPINFKSAESIKRKITTDKSDVHRIKDAVRTTIIAQRESIETILSELERNKAFVRIKRQEPCNYMGYSGNIVNIKTPNGIIAEIQVNTDKMIYAKEIPSIAKSIIGSKRYREIEMEVGKQGGLGHKYYEELRILNPTSTAAKTTALKMQEYYSYFK